MIYLFIGDQKSETTSETAKVFITNDFNDSVHSNWHRLHEFV